MAGQMVQSADGTEVITADAGAGRVIVVLHGGLSDESAWSKVAALLVDRFRVIRIRRRLYRLELPADPVTDYAREVDDVLAVVGSLGQPCLLVGHSSGAVVALETLVKDPKPFAGAALYEPPVMVDEPVGGNALAAARAADAKGRRGKALTIFLRHMVGLSGPVPTVVGLLLPVLPGLRKYVTRQLDDTEAINRLGVRLEAYAGITVPVLLITGARSTRSLLGRSDALAAVLPGVKRAVMPDQAHGATQRDPAQLARLVADFAEQVLPSGDR
jgi:pimeloyl-ACP methyl ester carboxylesterase